jgi:hypothetical protein
MLARIGAWITSCRRKTKSTTTVSNMNKGKIYTDQEMNMIEKEIRKSVLVRFGIKVADVIMAEPVSEKTNIIFN